MTVPATNRNRLRSAPARGDTACERSRSGRRRRGRLTPFRFGSGSTTRRPGGLFVRGDLVGNRRHRQPGDGRHRHLDRPRYRRELYGHGHAGQGQPLLGHDEGDPPSSRSLVKRTDKAYTAGKAGSGYFADVTIMPTRVSFSRTELREDIVNSVATGYYKNVLGWDGIAHPATTWLRPNASNSGLVDEIGSPVPGTPGPFSAGSFLWAIPQVHRPPGSTGNGSTYGTAQQTQVMAGATGAETTSKEGSSRSRTP